MNEELKTLFSYLVEDAGMIIGYWANTAVHDEESQTYWVRVRDDEWDDSMPKSKTITYNDLYLAVEKLAKGVVGVNSSTKAVCQQIICDPADDIDYDADDADCIVQVAMFGQIIFG
jgi:hypothetical protein